MQNLNENTVRRGAKSVGLLCLTIMLMGATVVYAMEYPDVDEKHKFFRSISVFTADKIVEGYPDKTFKPDQPINRVEALKVIVNALQETKVEDETVVNFSDVVDGDWFYSFVQTGVGRKIVEGYADGTFKPANQVTLAETVKMALVAKGHVLADLPYVDFHPNVNSEDWFANSLSYAYANNFVTLEQNGGFNPHRELNRGEFIDIVYRIRVTGKDQEFDISYNWDEENSHDGLLVSVPFEWRYYNLGEGVFMAYFAGGDPTFIRTVPNGSRIAINFWTNEEGLPAEEQFEKIKMQLTEEYNSLEIDFKEESRSFGETLTVLVAEMGVFNYYVYLENKSLIVAEGSFDATSLKSADLKKEIETIYEKIQYDKSLALTAAEKLSKARESINKKGEGMEVIKLFKKAELVHTDILGVGTGPVDYYFLAGANHTIKYERSFDVILDVLLGKQTEE